MLKRLTGVYFELVDSRGHDFGPNSNEVKEALKEVDAELVRVIDAVEEAGDINLMVFSDHGMAERRGGPSDARSGLINILDHVNETDWEHAVGSESGPNLQIWPKSDNEDWVSLAIYNDDFYPSYISISRRDLLLD